MKTENLNANGRDDSGSVLILALIIITVIGALLAVVLDFTDTSLISTPTLVTHRDTFHDVDGAVDAAINSIRGSSGLGTFGFSAPCGPFQAPSAPAGSGNVSVSVDCVPQPGSGTPDDTEIPRYAMNLLGPAGLSIGGNQTLTVDGGVYSHGVVDLNGQPGQSSFRAIESFGDLLAEGNCTPVQNHPESIQSVGGLLRCAQPAYGSFTGDSRGDDPGYLPSVATSSAMAVDPTGSCASSNSVVVFQQGIYTEVPQAPTGCNGSVWWFRPGVYYFDFPDARNNWQPNSLSGTYVVGGTLANGWGASTDSGVIDTPANVGKVCDRNADGVEFIMGGSSTLTLNSGGHLELCSSVSATSVSAAAQAKNFQQRIAYYGLGTGYAHPAQVTGQLRVETGSPVSPYPPPPPLTTAPTFLLADPNAKLIDGVTSDATLNKAVAGNGADTASLLLCGSQPCFEQIPPGSTIPSAPNSVTLKVRHIESDAGITTSVQIFLPVSNQTISRTLSDFLTTRTPPCGTNTSRCFDTIDLTPFLQGPYAYKDLNGMTVTYKAVLGGSATTAVDSFDGAELRTTYTPPGFETARCAVGQSAPCPAVVSTVSQSLYFHGTVYAPASSMNLVVHNKDTTIFDRGVIAKDMVVTVSDSSKQEDSPFQLPRTAASDRTVLFTGSVGGVPKIRALVTYRDYVWLDAAGSLCDQSAPAAGCVTVAYAGFKVTVQKWSVLR